MANLNQELVKNLNGICNANYSERAARYEEAILNINYIPIFLKIKNRFNIN